MFVEASVSKSSAPVCRWRPVMCGFVSYTPCKCHFGSIVVFIACVGPGAVSKCVTV